MTTKSVGNVAYHRTAGHALVRAPSAYNPEFLKLILCKSLLHLTKRRVPAHESTAAAGGQSSSIHRCNQRHYCHHGGCRIFSNPGCGGGGFGWEAGSGKSQAQEDPDRCV